MVGRPTRAHLDSFGEPTARLPQLIIPLHQAQGRSGVATQQGYSPHSEWSALSDRRRRRAGRQRLGITILKG